MAIFTSQFPVRWPAFRKNFVLTAVYCLVMLVSAFTAAGQTITSFSPSGGPVGTLVTVQGTGLSSVTSVTIGGKAAIIISNNGSQLAAMVMPGAVTGVVSVTGGSTVSSSTSFTVSPDTYPTIQSSPKLVGVPNYSTVGANGQGGALAISADDQTVAVGAPNDANGLGAVFIFARSAGSWVQQARITPGYGPNHLAFGYSVALSADGNTLIAGAFGDNSLVGAAYIYTRSGSTWTPQARLAGSGYTGKPWQGYSVAISADGKTAVEGGVEDNSNVGGVWVFAQNGGTWSQQGPELIGAGASGNAMQGYSVAISADGNTLVEGGTFDNDSPDPGAVWTFTRNNSTWIQMGSKLIITDATSEGSGFGAAVSLSADGATLGAGDNDHGWVFARSGTTWSEQAGNLSDANLPGAGPSVSADGNTLAVCGVNSSGVVGVQVFTRQGVTWSAQGSALVGSGATGNTIYGGGSAITLSADGSFLVSASQFDNVSVGASWIFQSTQSAQTLSSLQVNQGTLTPAFSSTTTAYTDLVLNAANSIQITPTAAVSGSTITVNGSAVASGAASNAIPLNVGMNTIPVVVTASGGTSLEYDLNVTRGSGTANLSSLVLGNSAILLPAFVPATTTYSGSLYYAQPTITPTTEDPNATVTVNGVAVVSGTTSAAVVGSTATVVVTAADGVTTKTYTVNLFQGDLSNSTSAALTSIKVGGGNLLPVFLGSTYTYKVVVSNSAQSITLSATATVASDAITVNGTGITGGVATPFQLYPGNNYFVITCTSQPNEFKTYTIYVTRGAPNNNDNLSQLKVSPGPLTPAFAAGTTSYSVSLADSVSTLKVLTAVADSGATIAINGTQVNSGTTTLVPVAYGTNTVNVVVTASDGVTAKTYSIATTRVAPESVDLYSLVVSNGSINAILTPSFSPTTTSYTTAVNNNVSSITVTPVLQQSTSTVTVNGVAVTDGSASAPINVVVGTNIISIVVTASDGVTTQTYTVTVTRERASNDNLVSLVPSAGVLSPAFAVGTTSYTASVNYYITSVTITPKTADTGARVMVNGSAVASGTASGPITLAVGSNTINVVVTAANGITTKTYTITMTRQASTSAQLSALSISSGALTPGFNSLTYSYNVTVNNTVTSVTFTPTVAVSSSTAKVNGTAVASGTASGPISLNVGANAIPIVVTASDGITMQTYTVTVTRVAASNDNLSALKISSGTLSPAFAAATTSYTDLVSNSVASITVTPSTADAGATVKVNGTTVASGSASGPIALVVGSNTINVVVTAANGVTTKTYSIVVTRSDGNASLSALAVSTGTLTPAFKATTTSYAVAVNNTVTSITVTPTVTVATSTVTVNGTAVVSGSASNAISLAVGANTINVVVTASDKITIDTYTITVTRAAASNDNLTNLKLSSGTLSPTFAAVTTGYTASVVNSVASVTVTPTAADPGAIVKVNGTAVTSGTASGAIPLAVGSNTINVLVTAANGVTNKTYSVVVTRASGGADQFDPISVTQPTETPALADDGIIVHKGVSPNGDGIDDFLQIDNITQYPDNRLAIMNRNGQLVYEVKGYDNSTKVFDGHSNKTGQMQLPGTYFFALDYTVKGIIKHITGFLVLKY